MIKRLAKSDIKELLNQTTKEWQTYVPIETKGGDILFTFLPKSKEKLQIALDRVNLKDEWIIISPKDIFFPQLEIMFKFDEETIDQQLDTSKKLIFGVKPCDTKGILFSDEFFKRNFEDIYYLTRIQNRLIVTIGCIKPPRPQACFCTSAKTGPFIESGYDLQFIDTGDYYFVEIGSDKGDNFVNFYSKFFKNSVKDDLNKIKDIKSLAINNIKLRVDFEKALDELISGNKVFEENYKRISERCIYCGGCLYTCPTCTCFNIFDDKRGNCGVRKRNWDACIFEGYTREASGYNPRDKKWIRTARRYEHKLKYDYKVTGTASCIACGRCLASCPVEIGMSKFIEEITTNTRKM